jgi:hypothetical protein
MMTFPVGPMHVKVNDQIPYFVPGRYGAAISWTVSGGEIISGQNTYHVVVLWTTVGSRKIEVTVNQPGHEPETDGITVIVDPG